MNLKFYVFSLERNFHYESRNVETENLKVIKKITLNMIKRVKKKRKRSTNWEFTTFSENLQQTQKWGNGSKKRGNRSTNWEFTTFSENRKLTQKKRKRTQKKRKPINKLRIYNFFWKPETDPKKEETDQQTENLKLFLKTGNGPKKRGNGPKKRGNQSTNWEFKTFSENRKLTQKKKKRTQKKLETNQM